MKTNSKSIKPNRLKVEVTLFLLISVISSIFAQDPANNKFYVGGGVGAYTGSSGGITANINLNLNRNNHIYTLGYNACTEFVIWDTPENFRNYHALYGMRWLTKKEMIAFTVQTGLSFTELTGRRAEKSTYVNLPIKLDLDLFVKKHFSFGFTSYNQLFGESLITSLALNLKFY